VIKPLSLVVFAIQIFSLAGNAHGQTGPTVVARALEFARDAQFKRSPAEAVAAFHRQMDTAFGPAAAVPLVTAKELSVVLYTPMTLLRVSIAERLRKMEPFDGIEMPAAIGILIEPKQIDAPDIAKVVVFRNGATIQPLSVAQFSSQPFRTPMGATTLKHAGIVQFPESAFAATVPVGVVLIPEVGDNIEIGISTLQLAMLSGTKDRLASSLVRVAAADVVKGFGQPSRIEGHRWTYQTRAGSLYVYLDDANVVNDVQPPTFDLIAIGWK
jgi:hypothetical protein